ncbi:hypothetical protein L1887_33428 [Cichorium endivia]|nr:hypothetical protein L1887_33428 [Cichorium endivia]
MVACKTQKERRKERERRKKEEQKAKEASYDELNHFKMRCLLSTENESIAAKFGKARRKSVVFAQQKENQQQMIQVHMEMRALNSIRNGAFSVLYLFLLFILVLCVL